MARQSWDKTEILQTLKKLHREGKDLSYARIGKRMQPLLSAAAYHFGSYRAALEKAGVDYREVVRRPRWTKQRAKCTQDCGALFVRCHDLHRKHDQDLISFRRFDNWRF